MTAAFSSLREDIAVTIPLETGWEMASSPEPADHASATALRFIPAKVPGTVASALRDQKSWRTGADIRFDAAEHWFRCRFHIDPVESGEKIILRIGGVATIAEVFLNGESILQSNSMFASHELDISSRIREQNELLIVCRSLSAAMRERRRQLPLARWKTRVVAEQQLRWFRTTLLGARLALVRNRNLWGRGDQSHWSAGAGFLSSSGRVRLPSRTGAEHLAFSYECEVSIPRHAQ